MLLNVGGIYRAKDALFIYKGYENTTSSHVFVPYKNPEAGEYRASDNEVSKFVEDAVLIFTDIILEEKYCPYIGGRECCARCLNLEREEREAIGKCMPSFLPEDIDPNEKHPYKCSDVVVYREFHEGDNKKGKVYCGAIKKWITLWKYPIYDKLAQQKLETDKRIKFLEFQVKEMSKDIDNLQKYSQKIESVFWVDRLYQ